MMILRGLCMYILKNNLENKINKTLGFNCGKLTNSGSEAIKYCLINANVKKETLVVMPVTICKSVVDAVLDYGCYPYFVDVDTDFCLDLKMVQDTFRNDISTIIYIHAYGIYKNISELVKFCKERSIILIEDSAQYINARNIYVKVPQGDFIIYSFGKGKPIDVEKYGFIASNKMDIKYYPNIVENDKYSLLYDKFTDIKTIIDNKLQKVKLYKQLLNTNNIKDNDNFIDNIFHRILFYQPQNYNDISKKMYQFMDKNKLDNYQSTILIEAFREPALQKKIPNVYQDLHLENFKTYEKLKKSYHYFRTCDWINEDNIKKICDFFYKVLNDNST